jgi:ParB family chromosome partitioning protein
VGIKIIRSTKQSLKGLGGTIDADSFMAEAKISESGRHCNLSGGKTKIERHPVMKNNFEPKIITLRELDLEDTRFRISEFFSSDRLVLSLKRIGLLHPLLVTFREGKIVLVSGWKRLSACLKLGIRRAPVLVLDEPDDLKAFLFALYENLAERDFSVLEKAEIVSRLRAFGLARSRIMKNILPLLQVPPTAFSLDSFLSISQLGPLAKEAIAGKNLPFPVARMLVEFQAEDLERIIPLLVPLGQNKQKEVLEDLLEISRRKNMTPRNILKTPSIRAVLQSSKWPSVQKSERLRRALRKERFPHLSAWEESFQSNLRELGWPKSISLAPSPFFETDDMEASFKFRDEKEFRAHLRRLLEISSRREFSRIFARPRRTAKTREIT